MRHHCECGKRKILGKAHLLTFYGRGDDQVLPRESKQRRPGMSPLRSSPEIVYQPPARKRRKLVDRIQTMLRTASSHKTLTAVSVLLILVLTNWVWGASASLRGEIAARYDIARGHYRQLTYGLPVPQRPRYAQVLKDRYGIEVQAAAGCIVSRSLRAYVRGYNTVSIAAANRRWRRDVIGDSWNEAGRIWRQNHPEALVSPH